MQRTEYMDANSKVFAAKGDTMEVHRAFYAQFVDQRTIAYVERIIGGEKIKASTDPHMNDILLKSWDDLTHQLPLAIRFTDVGDYATLAGLVCVAKEAARQWKESQ